MGSRGQGSRGKKKDPYADLDRASEKYWGLQERADKIYDVGGRYYDRETGHEVSRADVVRLSSELAKAKSRFEKLRDAAINEQQPAKTGQQNKAPKAAKETAGSFIQKQVNIDIEQFRSAATKQFDRRGMVNVDWNGMTRNQQNAILSLANKYPDRLQVLDNGAWMKAIIFRKRK